METRIRQRPKQEHRDRTPPGALSPGGYLFLFSPLYRGEPLNVSYASKHNSRAPRSVLKGRHIPSVFTSTPRLQQQPQLKEHITSNICRSPCQPYLTISGIAFTRVNRHCPAGCLPTPHSPPCSSLPQHYHILSPPPPSFPTSGPCPSSTPSHQQQCVCPISSPCSIRYNSRDQHECASSK